MLVYACFAIGILVGATSPRVLIPTVAYCLGLLHFGGISEDYCIALLAVYICSWIVAAFRE